MRGTLSLVAACAIGGVVGFSYSVRSDAEAPNLADEWESMPVGDGSNLGQYQYAFQTALRGGAAFLGIKEHCTYEGVPRSQDRTPSVLVLGVVTTDEGFLLARVTVRHAGSMDEYQQRCVSGWLTGAVLEVPGLEPGRRFRFTYPVKL